MPLPDGRSLIITAVPARQGPVGIEGLTGHVTGFVLSVEGAKDMYVSGDTVWFSGLAEIARRFDVGLAVLFAGAAQPRGPFNLGWSHYTQSQQDLVKAFETVGIGDRIEKLTPAVAVSIEV
jgi:hypothetical protein